MDKLAGRERNSNIELCRIVCMLMIIAHHCVSHGGAAGMELCTNKYIAWFILPAGKFCFVAFLAISAWFLADKEFHMERFLKIWGMVFFYSFSFAAVSVLLGAQFTWRNWFSVLLPVTGNSHGFAASYLAFYLLVPFLNVIAKNITRIQLKWLAVLLFYFQVLSQVIGTVSGYYQPISSELLLFILCYFAALYLKRYPLSITSNSLIMAIVIIIVWMLVFGLYCWNLTSGADNLLCTLLLSLCRNESSILYLVGGYAIFFFFNSLRIPTIKIINKVASVTFGILLIHDHNFFRPILWRNIFRTTDWWYSEYFLLGVFLCTIIIFCAGMIIDIIRQKYLEKPLFTIKLVKNCCEKINRILNP